MSILVQTAGGRVNLATVPVGNAVATAHVLIDGDGVPYSATHPLLTAPAIFAVEFTDHSGSIATANAVALDLPADPARKGGSFRAAPTNTGIITVTLKDPSGNLHSELLLPGDGFPLTVNGYVIQDEVGISGDTVGDKFTGVTFA